MTQVNKNDVTQIFASNAPDQDKPPSFPNYTTGWGTSRSNNGKPTIKGFNFLQQRTDQNFLWIHQNGGALPYDSSIDYVDGSIVLKDGKLQQINDGAWSSYGSSDSDITTWTGNSQADENKKFVTTVNSYSELSSLKTADGRVAIVKGDGSYYYSDTQKAWIKDEPFAVYDFMVEQPIQYYYDQLGNWSDAIELAQLNIYTKGYSENLVFPCGQINITRPIYGGAALGLYLHNKYPNLNIYNASNNTFIKNPTLKITGQGRNLTTINFDGINTRDDLTWGSYGAIHTAPLDVDQQCGGSATVFYHMNCWTRVDLAGFTIQNVNTVNQNSRSCLHGIVLFRGNGSHVRDVVVQGFNGAGLLTDGFYDSWFENFTIFQCGRTSPKYDESTDTGYTTLDYQTYASLHIMCSRIGDPWDNCNFLRFKDFHIEDAHWSPADIIVSGNSSPIWFEDTHLEADDASSVAKLQEKYIMAIGGYGVTRFGQDTAKDYVFGSEKFVGNGGGYVYWHGGSCYSFTYSNGILMGAYTFLSLKDFKIPNGLQKIKLDATNASAQLIAENSDLGDVINNSNATQIELSKCNIKSYSQDYGLAPIMRDVQCSGVIKIGENSTNINQKLVLDKVTCSYATGIVNYGVIDITSTSTNQGTTLYVANGSSAIYDNYVINTLGAV